MPIDLSATHSATANSSSPSVLPYPRAEPTTELPPSSTLMVTHDKARRHYQRTHTTTLITRHLLFARQTAPQGIGSSPRHRRNSGEPPLPPQALAVAEDVPNRCGITT